MNRCSFSDAVLRQRLLVSTFHCTGSNVGGPSFSFCNNEEACDGDILPALPTSVLGDILPLEVVPLFNIPTDTFTDSELADFCPKPKKVSGESVLHANMALVGVAVAAYFV
jgi:hypothetical protein